MGRWYITLGWMALLWSGVGCGDDLLFEPDPLHLELVRVYARETGWADEAFGTDLVCIAASAPLCRCGPDRLEEIVAGLPPDQRLDINSAPLEELDRLPGIGPAIAERIIAYRQERPFFRVEDLTEVPGIGPARLASLVHLVRVTRVEMDPAAPNESRSPGAITDIGRALFGRLGKALSGGLLHGHRFW